MKKLFTLIAFLMVVMGAKAEWVEDYKIDYSTKADFPFYVMAYAPSIIDGVMVDNPVPYRKLWRGEEQDFPGESECSGTITVNGGSFYLQMLESNPWRQYFIADGIPTQLDGAYKITAMVKASQAINCEITMQWNWSGGAVQGSASIGTEWQEVEWEYSGIQGQSCALIAKPGVTDAVIEWKWLKVEHNQKATRPVEWRNILVDESGAYVDGVVNQLFKPFEMEFNEASADEIYAQVKKAATKEVDGEIVYYFESPAVDKAAYTTNASGKDISANFAWANQLFITSPEKIKANETIRITFDYKADKNANTNTQAHGRPSAYHWWSAIGDVAFTTEWQHKEATMDVTADHAKEEGMYSIAFNLNPENCDANTWYIKNIKVEKMVLDEGFFVASQNTSNGIEYDYDNATELVYDEAEGALVAVVGEKGKENTWINEIMISTKRGQDQSFKVNTIKPAYVKNDAEDWAAYQPSTNYKIKLPAAGVWSIRIIEDEDVPGTGYISFVKLEGEEEKEPVVIVANPTEVIINAVEREYTAAEAPEGYEFAKNDEGKDITGQPWDNQFCIMANRPIKSGEETVISFDYVAEKAAKANTQVTSDVPGGYLFWNCIGDVEFTTEEQHLEKAYKIPLGDQNAELTTQSITFNMAVIKDANVYRIKNIIWKTADDSESLIDMEGTKNFFVKTGANTGFFEAGTDGIEEIVVDKATSNAIYNLAGQRVSKSFKGVAIKNGQKFIVK